MLALVWATLLFWTAYRLQGKLDDLAHDVRQAVKRLSHKARIGHTDVALDQVLRWTGEAMASGDGLSEGELALVVVKAMRQEGALEVTDVPNMQRVKHTVTKDNLLTVPS